MKMNKKILVTGSNGYIGSTFMSLYKENSYGIDVVKDDDMFFVDKKVDLSNSLELQTILDNNDFSAIIHIGAIKDLRECEANPNLAKNISVNSTEILTNYAFKKNIPLIYISSDQVFGKSSGPHKEEDNKDPLSVYAKIKDECENIVLSKGKTVVRLSLVLGLDVDDTQLRNPFLRNQSMFISYVLNRLDNNQEVTFESDLFCSPIDVYDVCLGLNTLLNNNLTGVYHLAGPDKISRYDMALTVAKKLSKDSLVNKQDSTHDKIRSKDASLNINKLYFETSFVPKDFKTNVEKEFIYFNRIKVLNKIYNEYIKDVFLVYYYGSLVSKKKIFLTDKTDIDLTVVVENIIDFCKNTKLNDAKYASEFLETNKVQYLCLKGYLDGVEYSIDVLDKKTFEERFLRDLSKEKNSIISYKWGISPQINEYQVNSFEGKSKYVRKKCMILENGCAIGLNEFNIIENKYYHGIPTVKILTSSLVYEKEEGYYNKILNRFTKELIKRKITDCDSSCGTLRNLLLHKNLLNKMTIKSIYQLENGL